MILLRSQQKTLPSAMKRKYFILLLFSITLILSSVPVYASSSSLRIGVLLIEDSVPLYVAQQEKYYEKENIDVKLIPFLSALERDSALTSGAIDGAISDPVGAILLDQGRGIVQITSLCLGETPEEGQFAILVAPKSNVRSIEALKNVDIAVSNNTIIEYVTDRLLEQQGVAAEDIHTIEVRKMPIRMQMLLSGSVQAATLPEPLASIAQANGARILLSDGNGRQSISQTVMIFRKDTLQAQKEDIRAFYRALTLGVQAINRNPESYRSLFMEKGRIPQFLEDQYAIPTYPLPKPFPQSLYSPVMEWLTTKNLVPPLAYDTMVATDFAEK